jgi:hypothetical protein
MGCSVGRWFSLIGGFSLALALCLTPAIALAAASGLTPNFEGQVEEVDLTNALNPKIKVKVIKAEEPLKPGQSVVLIVGFSAAKGGKIDWTKPANRAKAIVLSLSPGDVIWAVAGKPKDYKLKDYYAAAALGLVSTSLKLDFPGREKIAGESLINQARFARDRVAIIVLLGDYQKLADLAADPKTRDEAVAQIKKVQEEFLKGLGPGLFEVTQRLELLPSLAGRVNLQGLQAVAAHPLVKSIEEDRPISLSGPKAGGVKVK